MNESLIYKFEKRIYSLLPHEPETMAAALFIIVMSAYYLWRMFAITPQYDELYTYYTFISRGPIYSAIHWPLPNNHVGYSVFSAIFDYSGNSYIGLRGVSYFCAISNLILIYRICKNYFSHGLSFGAVALYACMQIVNEYSVQGRGYTLATTCFLMTIYCAGKICTLNETKDIYYKALAIAFVIGLYTVPTSVYWVIPMAVAILAYLFINAYKNRKMHVNLVSSPYFRKFKNVFWHGFAAACITVVLYALIWLAIGSNLLVKTEGSDYYGLGHLTVLLRAPINALITGARYMLDQPYIQSMTSGEFRENAFGWGVNLFNYMLPGMTFLFPVTIIITIIIAVYECVMHFAYSRTIINIICIANIVITALILIIQCKLPYLRVFSYGAVIMVFCFCTCLEALINFSIRLYNKKIAAETEEGNASIAHNEIEQTISTGKWYSGLGVYIPLVSMIILFIVRFLSPEYNAQLGSRETSLYNTMYVANVGMRSTPCVLDCDQQYLLKFGWDIDCDKTDVDGSDCVIIDKNLMSPGYSGNDFWKFYVSYDSINWDYISTMMAIYENEDFIVYVK